MAVEMRDKPLSQSRSLQDWMRDYPGCRACGGPETPVDAVAYDSRAVRPGSVLVCIPGFVEDGTRFWEEACEQGVSAVVVESEEVKNALEARGVSWAWVDRARDALAYLSQALMGWPAEALRVQACFGASGRENLARLLQMWFQQIDGRSACLYGMHQVLGSSCYYSGRTVPQALEWARGLAAARQARMDRVFLPVAEAALELHRAAWMRWDTVLLLPGSPDPNNEEERERLLSAKQAVICVDDARGQAWLKLFRTQAKPCISVGWSEEAQVHLERVSPLKGAFARCSFTETEKITETSSRTHSDQTLDLGQQVRCAWNTESGSGETLWQVQVPGLFHPINLAMGWAQLLLDEADADLLTRAGQVLPQLILPGHTEPIVTRTGKRLVLDSAWKPDPLRELLRGLRPWVAPGGRLLLLFGSGGERPRAQRLELGRVCAEEADEVILTVSHPRSEGGAGIVSQLEEGFFQCPSAPPHRCIPDRRKALETLLEASRPEDLCVLAGRGEEGYLIDAHSLVFGTDASVLELLDGPLCAPSRSLNMPDAWIADSVSVPAAPAKSAVPVEVPAFTDRTEGGFPWIP